MKTTSDRRATAELLIATIETAMTSDEGKISAKE